MSAYQPSYTPQFKKDWKRCGKSGQPLAEAEAVIRTLLEGQPLEAKFKDHQLRGNNKDFRECHLKPDWLLVYRIEGRTLSLVRTGSHADLFGL